MPKNKVTCSHTSLLLLIISLTTISLLPIPRSLAETASIPLPSNAPLQLDLLKNPPNYIITANTIEQGKLTIPSLWRVKENTESKLLDNWLAYPQTEQEPARVDLIVNQQIWSLLDYLERYDFLNRFGTAVRQDGYNVRVFSNQQELLATYTCNFTSKDQPLCNIQWNLQNKLGVRRSL
jgi:maltodextrin utilization protein YvdJ